MGVPAVSIQAPMIERIPDLIRASGLEVNSRRISERDAAVGLVLSLECHSASGVSIDIAVTRRRTDFALVLYPKSQLRYRKQESAALQHVEHELRRAGAENLLLDSHDGASRPSE